MGLLESEGTTKQGYLKVAIYGDAGSGKTYTAIKIATSIGKTAVIDTERGCEPYRSQFRNPDGTPFLVASISTLAKASEVLQEAIDNKCQCLVIDQFTHLWEDAQESYLDKERDKNSKTWSIIESTGNIPFTSWGRIKKPYKLFIRELLNSPLHIFALGRMSIDYKIVSGAPEKVGEKMDAEKHTQYEFSILIKMEHQKRKREWLALVEKDRWNQIGGQVFSNPDVSIFDKILPMLGSTHLPLPDNENDIIPDTKGNPLQETTQNHAQPKSANKKDKLDKVIISPITPRQRKLINILASKLGVDKKDIEKVCESVETSMAGDIINRLTTNDVSDFVTV